MKHVATPMSSGPDERPVSFNWAGGCVDRPAADRDAQLAERFIAKKKPTCAPMREPLLSAVEIQPSSEGFCGKGDRMTSFRLILNRIFTIRSKTRRR